MGVIATPSASEQSANLHVLVERFCWSIEDAGELMLNVDDQPDAEVVGCVLAAAQHLEDALQLSNVIRAFRL